MVEVIPKTIKEKAPKFQYILFWFSFLLLILVALLFHLFNYQEKRATIALADLKRKIAQTRTPQQIALEKEIVTYQKKIEDLSILLNSHKQTSLFFETLEKSTLPGVYFSSLNLDLKDNLAILSGAAKDLSTLSRQLLVFENNSLIEKAEVSEIKFSEEGDIIFKVDLLFSPEIFNF
jgi:hypothetical protein